MGMAQGLSLLMLVFHLLTNCTGAESENAAGHNTDAPVYRLLYLITYCEVVDLDKYKLCCSTLLKTSIL